MSELSASSEAIQKARNLWGDMLAKQVLGLVINSIHFANQNVKPPLPVNCFKLQIAEIPSHHPSGVEAPRVAGLHDKLRGFSLLIDSKSPEVALEQLKEVVTFETARIRLFQERTGRGYYRNNDENSELDVCVEDGMVVNTVEEILSAEERPGLGDYQSYSTPTGLINNGIKTRLALGKSSRVDHDPINKLRFGTPAFSRPGYKIGHAIVRSAMEEFDMSFEDMIIQPPKFFSDYAELMVFE